MVEAALMVASASPLIAEDYRSYFRIEGGATLSNGANFRDSGDGKNSACVASGSGCGGRLNNIGDGGVIGLGFGYMPTRWLQSELMVNVRAGLKLSDSDQGFPRSTNYHATINSTSFMFNNYLFLPLPGTSRFSVFGGAGVGANISDVGVVSYFDGTAPPSSGSVPGGIRTNFAWQAAGGLEMKLNSTITLDGMYRYFDGGGLSTSSSGGRDSYAGAFDYPGMHGRLTANEVVASIKLGF